MSTNPESNRPESARPVRATIWTLDGQEIAKGPLSLPAPDTRGLFQAEFGATVPRMGFPKEVVATTENKRYRILDVENCPDWPAHFHFLKWEELPEPVEPDDWPQNPE